MAVASKRELVLASDPRAGLDMVALRMIAFRPAIIFSDNIEVPPAKKPEPPALPVVSPDATSDHSRHVISGSRIVDSTLVQAPPRSVTADDTAQPSEGAAANTASHRPVDVAAGVSSDMHDISEMEQSSEVDDGHSSGNSVVDTCNSSSEPEEDLPTSRSWPDFFDSLGLKGVIHTVASHFELVNAFDRTLCFQLAPDNATLFNERHQRSLAVAIEQVLEKPVSVEVCLGDTSDQTPARQRELYEIQRLKAAANALDKDDCLTALLTEFDAVVVPNSIRPPLVEI